MSLNLRFKMPNSKIICSICLSVCLSVVRFYYVIRRVFTYLQLQLRILISYRNCEPKSNKQIKKTFSIWLFLWVQEDKGSSLSLRVHLVLIALFLEFLFNWHFTSESHRYNFRVNQMSCRRRESLHKSVTNFESHFK